MNTFFRDACRQHKVLHHHGQHCLSSFLLLHQLLLLLVLRLALVVKPKLTAPLSWAACRRATAGGRTSSASLLLSLLLHDGDRVEHRLHLALVVHRLDQRLQAAAQTSADKRCIAGKRRRSS